MTPRSVVITAAQAAVLRDLCETGGTTDSPNRTALAVAVLRGDIRPAVRGRDSWWKENAA